MQERSLYDSCARRGKKVKEAKEKDRDGWWFFYRVPILVLNCSGFPSFSFFTLLLESIPLLEIIVFINLSPSQARDLFDA